LIAFLSTANGVLNVWIDSIPPNKPKLITRERGRGVQSVSWGPTSRHIIYLRDPTGAENLQVVAVDLRTWEERELVPFGHLHTRLVAVNPRFPNDVLVESNPDDPARRDVFRASLSTMKLEKIAVNPGFAEWLVDDRLEGRDGLRYHHDGSSELMVREWPTSPWRPLLAMEPEGSITSFPVGFDLNGHNAFVVSSCGADTGRLLRINARTGESTVVAADPHYDITEVLLNRGTREPELVGLQRERPEYWPLNAVVEEDLSAIQGRN
jgi:hypothetical protein